MKPNAISALKARASSNTIYQRHVNADYFEKIWLIIIKYHQISDYLIHLYYWPRSIIYIVWKEEVFNRVMIILDFWQKLAVNKIIAYFIWYTLHYLHRHRMPNNFIESWFMIDVETLGQIWIDILKCHYCRISRKPIFIKMTIPEIL